MTADHVAHNAEPGPFVVRWEGRYIGMYGRGCKTCGWFIPNDEDPDDRQWLGHGHDPLYDIEERVHHTAPGGYVPVEDVIYLLDRFDPLDREGAGDRTDSSEGAT